ncbi:MAG: Gfo/Idh/MocA family oxidoreductase [Chloroflexi bacterium]|nr:Gfo/Idh/MocA family oxidoreductase [Chloroflexota bacterium]
MEKVGFGLIGAGIVGGAWHAHVYHHMPRAELVAICDLNEARAREVADRYGVAHVYTDYRDLLARDDIAAVSIATPDFAHREIAIAAAQAGKHILVEKPIATTSEDAYAIVAAAEKAGVKLMVDYHNRANPAFVSARQAVQAGELGELRYIYARLSNTTFVPTQMLPWAAQSSALWFLASHMLDMACWLLGDKPSRVYAVSRSGVLQSLGIDTQDFHIAIVEFAGGAVLTLENAWILPETEPNVFNLKMELLGSQGSLYINTSDNRTVEKYTQAAASLPDTLGFTLDAGSARLSGFVLESITRFVDAVVDDKPLLATGPEAALVTRALCAIEESARLSQPVDLL